MAKKLFYLILLLPITIWALDSVRENTSHDAIKLSLSVDGGMIYPNKDNIVNLTFANTTDKPINIFFIDMNNVTMTNFLQNIFDLIDENGNSLGNSLIGSYSHGYQITQADFHTISPNSKITFKQNVFFATPNKSFKKTKHIILKWRYQNDNQEVNSTIIKDVFIGKSSTRLRVK